MKKSLFLILVLAGLSLLSLPLAVAVIGAGEDRIVIAQEVISGDKEAAAGVTLTLKSHWDGRLLWEAEYTIDEKDGTTSAFEFSDSKVSFGWERQWDAGLYFGTDLSVFEGRNCMSNSAQSFALPRISVDLVSRGTGVKFSETMRVGDYYEKYPLILRLEGGVLQYDSYNKATGYLINLFNIPTCEDRLEVYVERYYEKHGNLRFVRGIRVYDSQSVEIVDASAFAQEGMYFAYDLASTETGECVERGQNAGIFYCPYQRDENGIRIDLNELKKVCDFPKDMVLIDLALDTKEEYFYLLAKGSEGVRLFVYRKEEDKGMPLGGLVLQEEIPLEGMEENGSFCRFSFVDGGILLTWNDNNFSFVEKTEGRHTFWCSGRFPETMGQFGAEGVQNPFPRENTCLFDGKRLVLAAFENWDDMAVRLVVHGRDGQLYCGRYLNSQDGEYFEDGRGISPQGARIWAPNSAWTMEAGDEIVTALKFKTEEGEN